MQKILLFILGIVLGISGFIFLFHTMNNIHVTAVFKELEPFPHNLPIYYKGFKLGRSLRVYPAKNFKNTRIELLLNVRGVELPDNIIAKVRTKNKRDYIELVYPPAPSVTYLKNHSEIEGVKGVSFSSFVDGQLNSGSLDGLTDSLNTTVQNAGETLNALTGLFETASGILNDLRPSLKESGDNLVVTTRNLAQLSEELNSSLGENRLKNSISNLELTTRNIELASKNVSSLTEKTEKETVLLVNTLVKRANVLVCNLNLVAENLNDIIKGFKVTLSKKFAGMRLIFGKAID